MRILSRQPGAERVDDAPTTVDDETALVTEETPTRTGRAAAGPARGQSVTASRPAVEPTPAPAAPAGVDTDRTAAAHRVDEPAVVTRRSRVGLGATLGLIVGLTALYATLTGLLAPVGIALGVLGLLMTAGGFAGARADGVNGHSLALLGLLASAAALVLGVLATTDSVSWLNSHTDTVPGVRDWLNSHMSWLKTW